MSQPIPKPTQPTAYTQSAPAASQHERIISPWTSVLIGVLAGLLGLAPWLVTGAQLPVQNLWGTEVLPAQMPVSLLPVSQYELTTLVALMTAGGAIAGFTLRLCRPVRRRAATWSAAAGVLAVQGAATVQAFSVVRAGLAPGSASDLYFAGLLGGVVAAVAASLVALFLLASRSPARLALGVGLMAVPIASWVVEWFVNLSDVGNVPAVVLMLARWLPAVLVGVALAWCGIRPTTRVLVWMVDLALLWVVPALFTSVNYVFGTRVYLGDFDEMAILARQILAATLGPAGGAGPLVALALAIAATGAGALDVRRRRQARNPGNARLSARE
ncbi:MAG: putative rane protein [Pseudarthrobacter sp.]|nr:putative rane protein [Pseudarthrobacter sp.]